MDFPPVTTLVNATFDHLNHREANHGVGLPVKAPQPVVSGQGLDGAGAGSNLDGSTDGDMSSAGSLLNVKA